MRSGGLYAPPSAGPKHERTLIEVVRATASSLPRIASVAAALGGLYVLEGSTLDGYGRAPSGEEEMLAAVVATFRAFEIWFSTPPGSWRAGGA